MSDSPETQAEGQAPAPKAGPRGAVLIGALVGTLLVGGAAGFLAVGPVIAKKSGYVVKAAAADSGEEGAAAEGEDGAAAEGESAAEGGEHGAAKEGEGGAESTVHLIDNLVLNPAGSGGQRFLMLAAAIEFNDAASLETLKGRDAEARDVVLRVLGVRSVDDLSEMSNRESIKKELADSLSTLFPKKSRKKAIRRVYFPQWVIQ